MKTTQNKYSRFQKLFSGPNEQGWPGGPRPPQFFRNSILAPYLAPPIFLRSINDGPSTNLDLRTALVLNTFQGNYFHTLLK